MHVRLVLIAVASMLVVASCDSEKKSPWRPSDGQLHFHCVLLARNYEKELRGYEKEQTKTRALVLRGVLGVVVDAGAICLGDMPGEWERSYGRLDAIDGALIDWTPGDARNKELLGLAEGMRRYLRLGFRERGLRLSGIPGDQVEWRKMWNAELGDDYP